MAPVPPYPQPTADPLDFTRLREVADGDSGFQHQLLHTFLADMTQRLDLVLDALDCHDFGTVLLESHNIKGASNNVGARPLRAAAERCESAARNSRVQECREALATMVEELGRVRVVIEDFTA